MEKNSLRLVVLGASGQLGSSFRTLSVNYPHFSFQFLDKNKLDISDKIAVRAFFEKEQFDYCINCAAFTAVDLAEEKMELATKINKDAVEHLAEITFENEVSFIHFSTDYVYADNQNQPIKEDGPNAPLNIYGKTKLAGEIAAMDNNPNTLIIRTSWVYGPHGKNFLKTMLRLGRQRANLSVVFDQIGAPTYTEDLAMSILNIIGDNPKEQVNGIFNFSNEGVASWYDFAKAIFEQEQLNCELLPILSEAYPTPAKRPHFSLLDKSKIKEQFGIVIPHWRDSLRKCLTDHRDSIYSSLNG